MSANRYSGKLYYGDSSDHLDIAAFIVRGHEIAFSLASVTQDHGRWEAESGQTAKHQPDGTYTANRVRAHKIGVLAASPWDIIFRISYEETGERIEVAGELIEAGVAYEFDGELDAIAM